MGKNFWSKFKKPLFPSVMKPVKALGKKVGHDIRHGAEEVKDAIVHHPVQAAVMGGTLVLGIAATALTGGLAAPEVAETLIEEDAIFVGSEVGGNVVADSLATGSEFVSVPEVAVEPEISSFQQASNLMSKEPQMVEQVVDLGAAPKPLPEPVMEPEPFVEPDPLPEPEPEVLEEKVVQLDPEAEPPVEPEAPEPQIEEEFTDPEEIPKDHPYHPDNIEPANPEAELPNESEFQPIEEEAPVEEIEPEEKINPMKQEIDEIPDGDPELKGDLDFEDLDEEDMLDMNNENDMTPEEWEDFKEAKEFKEFNELQIARNEEEVAKAFARKPTLLQQVLQKGRAGIKLVNKVADKIAKIGAVSAGMGVVIGAIKGLKDEKTLKGKINKVKEIIGHIDNLGKGVKGLKDDKQGVIIVDKKPLEPVNKPINKSTDQIKKEDDIKQSNSGLDDLREGLGVVDEGVKALNNLAQTNFTNRTHNNTLTENLQDNKVDMKNINNSGLIIDKNLQAVKKDNNNEDNINDLKNTIDKPNTPNEFITRLNEYNTRDSKMDFLADNYDTLTTFSDMDIERIIASV